MAPPLLRPVAAALVAGLTLAVGLAGCAAPAPSATVEPAGVTVSPAPATTATPTAGPSEALPAPAPLPAGGSWVTSAAHGVRFAVPAGWGMFDLSTFTDPAVRTALEPVATKLGLTVDEYIRELTQRNDAIVTGPDRNGFSATVSVRKEAAPVSSYVPTVAEAQVLVEAIGGTVTAVDRVTTPLGAGYITRYTRPAEANPATVLSCASLGLPSAKNTMFLATVESDQDAEREALLTLITTTLQRA
nr:hypothetical protein [Propionibacterium sp.]